MARIQLNNIQKRWGAVWGVRDVNLDIADKEFVIFLGPSGCGKTTTMRMISGLEDPSAGEIIMDGEVMNGIDARDRDVAMVFQGYALYPNMSVYENIRFPLRMRGVPKARHDRMIRRAAELVELSEYLDRKPGALSGGQRQRAALARAIVRQPHAFLMDEPLSNLDAKLRQHMRVQIKHIQRELQITTIYVTHDQIEAMTLAHRVAVMDAGVLQQVAEPKEIYDNPATRFVARFIGSPAMNIVTGSVADGRVAVEDGAVPLEGFAPRERVSFGFRPEDCNLVAPEDGMLKARIFSNEMTGNETIVTCEIGADHVVVRMDKDFDKQPDDWVGIDVNPDKARLFDFESGERVHA